MDTVWPLGFVIIAVVSFGLSAGDGDTRRRVLVLLLTAVWGPGYEKNTNYLRFHMAKLRRKLEEDPSRPVYLLTEPGMGYRYQPHRAH